MWAVKNLSSICRLPKYCKFSGFWFKKWGTEQMDPHVKSYLHQTAAYQADEYHGS
jgi:hypothetical protein